MRWREPHTESLILHSEFPRVLPELLSGVPLDARLLVVTDSMLALPIELYSAPRPTRVLCAWPELRARGLGPFVRFLTELRRDQLERQQRRFTPERFRRELAQATHLLLLNAAPRDYEAPELELVPVRAIGASEKPAARLFAVVRR